MMKNRGRISAWETLLNSHPLRTVERACAVTEIIASAEYITNSSDREVGGLNHWKHLRYQFEGGFAKVWDRLSDSSAEKAYVGIHSLRIVHALGLVSPSKSNRMRAWCNMFLAGSQLFLQPRQFYGTDGSDQLSFLANTAVGLGRLIGTDNSRWAASDFLALQVLISYTVAGLAKAPGTKWRTGEALERIMSTQTYGSSGFYEFLKKHQSIGRALTKGTVLVESIMPLGLVTKRSTKAILATFALFHLANAKFMGLGRFVLPFTSMYPAIWSLRTNSYSGGV